MSTDREARLANLQVQLAARLKPVCEHWPEEMFEEMVRGLAALTYKYESTEPVYDPQPTEQMIAAIIPSERIMLPP